ncbi:DNA repair protein RadA [Aciditerrimonas ferrireducens]|jgi:DNA repair protein RadA/Sms|uniref:DNA repair protein RadA n=1 Tax=Aciditerrimonas ferrireducens TaxID=667306 RepID=UPI002003A9F4|nr:DNA repair protein RadA [Aciditerrimonas ferrireducens]MCK4175914.1 DNA repair protein RadA [Aciditerrimonas ferrireducens]
MGTTVLRFSCATCGAKAARWAGRCGRCGTWNSLVEQPVRDAGLRWDGLGAAAEALAASQRRHPTWRSRSGAAEGSDSGALVPLAEVDGEAAEAVPTGVTELDEVLAGGIVPGSVTLLGGEPGVGKSTLLLQVATAVAREGRRAVLVSAEESVTQVRRRAERLGPIPEALLVVASTDASLLDELAPLAPALVVVDSVQTMADREVAGGPGTVAQVRAVAERAVALAKSEGVAVVLVGHVTKDGSLAGPRVLEHLVDTVVTVEGDRHQALRVVRTVKHRFGPAGQLGLFEMGERGLQGVLDPSALLLGDRAVGCPGSAVVAALDGRRAVVCEVQALVAPGSPVAPAQRRAQGLDPGRLAQLLAVLDRRAGALRGSLDVFVSVVGGLRLSEPAADLGVALAVASAAWDRPVPADLAACGEVGLGGEVRRVPGVAQRVAAAGAAGFSRLLVPGGAGSRRSEETTSGSCRAVPVRSVAEALAVALGQR